MYCNYKRTKNKTYCKKTHETQTSRPSWLLFRVCMMRKTFFQSFLCEQTTNCFFVFFSSFCCGDEAASSAAHPYIKLKPQAYECVCVVAEIERKKRRKEMIWACDVSLHRRSQGVSKHVCVCVCVRERQMVSRPPEWCSGPKKHLRMEETDSYSPLTLYVGIFIYPTNQKNRMFIKSTAPHLSKWRPTRLGHVFFWCLHGFSSRYSGFLPQPQNWLLKRCKCERERLFIPVYYSKPAID